MSQATALFLLALPALAWQVQSDELPPDTIIVLQRGACERRCAVYNVIIFADGSVIFDGRHYVRQVGVVKSSVTRETLAGLLHDANALHFFDLKDRYGYGSSAGCDSIRSDAPSAILTIASAGRSKTVLHHHGCVSTDADRLTAFEDKIDKAVNAVRWIK
jgi:hypothetical protein